MSSPPSVATPATRLYRFLFRARIVGIFEWLCPSCGTFNRSRLRPQSYLLKCRNHDDCRRTWALGHALHEMPKGPRSGIPEDYLIPEGLREAMPAGDVGRYWKMGRLVHCVHAKGGKLAIPED